MELLKSEFGLNGKIKVLTVKEFLEKAEISVRLQNVLQANYSEDTDIDDISLHGLRNCSFKTEIEFLEQVIILMKNDSYRGSKEKV